jgi:hypothetical protein
MGALRKEPRGKEPRGTEPRGTETRGGEQPERDDLFDSVDVPATVVCAICGDAECPGCANEVSRSGVVAVVPWERPGAGFATRLWATARASTFDAERFFESLPDGPIAPALRFAIVCELLASSAVALCVVPVVLALAPDWLRHVVFERGGLLARATFAGIPALALVLVLAHAAHGWALYFGARKLPSASRGPSRAIRFGLYAAGWDLVIGPLGVVLAGVKEGPKRALQVATVASGLPGRSARAFLRGAYKLDAREMARPLRASYVAVVLATIIATVLVLSAAIALVLA